MKRGEKNRFMYGSSNTSSDVGISMSEHGGGKVVVVSVAMLAIVNLVIIISTYVQKRHRYPKLLQIQAAVGVCAK